MRSTTILAVALLMGIMLFSTVKSNELGNAEAVGMEAAPHKVVKRASVITQRFQFVADKAAEGEGQDARGCCSCGSHSCCGSMCHGRR